MKKLFHNNKSILLYFGILSAPTNCTTKQEIIVKKDGTASVITSADNALDENYKLENDPFYKSNLITNLSWGGYKKFNVTFDITAIDSVGNYLSPVFNKNYFQFEYNQDTLTITDGNGSTFKEDNWYCCGSQIEITSERSIKNVQTKNSYIKHKKDKIVILKSKHEFRRKKKNMHLVIVFDK